MSKVKINNASYSDIENNVIKAMECLNNAEEEWADKFTDLYHNFFESGFMEALYEDAESSYYTWKKGLSAVSITVGATALGLSFGPIGGIIGLVIGAILGITSAVMTDPIWLTVSRDTFKQLLLNCKAGNDDNYVKMVNIATEIYNVQVSLEKIKTLVNEYNQLYANLTEAAEGANVKLISSEKDELTILGIATSVEIDGETVELTTSEALNAMFTYNETVMNAEIAADYLERTYGYEINYTDLVKNANSFMANTIKSDLYTHEFIEYILPDYTPSQTSAVEAATGATGIDLDKIQSALKNNQDIMGNVALFGGLLGMPLIGKVTMNSVDDGNSNNISTPAPSPSPSPSGGSSGTVATSPSVTPGEVSGGTISSVTPNPEPEPEQEEPDVPINTIEIVKIVDTELPENVEVAYDVDYDLRAREQFEFEQDFDEIMEKREMIINDIEEKFAIGNVESLKEELAEYGFNKAEIETIIQDKFLTTRAILEGDQRAQLAQRAHALAEAAGVKDFKSMYEERPNFDDLNTNEASQELTLASDDEKVSRLYKEMKQSRDEYYEAVDSANELLNTVNDNKKTMEELQDKYVKEYGEDTSKWTEDAAKEYNEAINNYNKSVEAANEQLKVIEEKQKTFEAADEKLQEARIEYYEKQNEEQTVSVVGSGNDTIVTNTDNVVSSSDSDGNTVTVSDDGTINVTLTLDSEGQTLNGSPSTGAQDVADTDQLILDSLKIVDGELVVNN